MEMLTAIINHKLFHQDQDFHPRPWR